MIRIFWKYFKEILFSSKRNLWNFWKINNSENYNLSDGKINIQKNLIRKDGEIDKENLIQFVKEAKKFPNLKDEEIALLAATK